MDRSKLKWIALVGGALVLLFFVVLVLLLTREYDSQRLGRMILGQVESEETRISAEGFTFHPLSGLEMRGVTMESAIPDGVMSATVHKIVGDGP